MITVSDGIPRRVMAWRNRDAAGLGQFPPGGANGPSPVLLRARRTDTVRYHVTEKIISYEIRVNKIEYYFMRRVDNAVGWITSYGRRDRAYVTTRMSHPETWNSDLNMHARTHPRRGSNGHSFHEILNSLCGIRGSSPSARRASLLFFSSASSPTGTTLVFKKHFTLSTCPGWLIWQCPKCWQALPRQPSTLGSGPTRPRFSLSLISPVIYVLFTNIVLYCEIEHANTTGWLCSTQSPFFSRRGSYF